MKHPLHQSQTVPFEDLQITAGPAHALAPGLAEGNGLLVKEFGFFRVGNAAAAQHLIGGKLQVLRQ